MKRRIKKNKTKKLRTIVAPECALILTPNGKKGLAPLKTPQNDGNVYIINVHVCNSTTS